VSRQQVLLAFFLFCLLLAPGCGPEFPPSWLIEAAPLGPDGQVDAAGKLRVLGLRADPPEGAPGTVVTVRSLVVKNPLQGSVVTVNGQSLRTPTPPDLGAVWLACREPPSQASPQPCGLAQEGSAAPLDLERLPAMDLGDAGPATQLTLPSGELPYERLVTLVVADRTMPGGAEGCFAQAAQRGGVSPLPNHCVIAVKRIRVSMSERPNKNPELAGLFFGDSAESLTGLSESLAGGMGSYPLIAADVADDDRPRLVLSAERAADAVEVGTSADGKPQNETLSISFFTSAGTLEAGRGTFLDLSCEANPQECPQLTTAQVSWQPPPARDAALVPGGRVFFFVVLRDDRGGLSFRRGAAASR
jgi:hypothetical protein